jgi:hypothetical protein
MDAYNKKIKDMISELDSKKHYDEPRQMFHESVHSPRKHILAGHNDFVGAGNISPGVNDMKGDVTGPVPKTKRTSKRGELVRKIMRERGMTLPQASKFIKNNNM